MVSVFAPSLFNHTVILNCSISALPSTLSTLSIMSYSKRISYSMSRDEYYFADQAAHKQWLYEKQCEEEEAVEDMQRADKLMIYVTRIKKEYAEQLKKYTNNTEVWSPFAMDFQTWKTKSICYLLKFILDNNAVTYLDSHYLWRDHDFRKVMLDHSCPHCKDIMNQIANEDCDTDSLTCLPCLHPIPETPDSPFHTWDPKLALVNRL